MDNCQEQPRRFMPSTRRLVQLYAALLYNANLKGFSDGKLYTGASKALCVPGLNCYSCPGAIAACPLGALQNALAASGHSAPWYAAGILLLFAVILGRTVCGWLCPVGLVQELLYRVPTPKVRKSRVTRALSYVKYGVLAVFVIILPLAWGLARGLPLPAFCKYICPAGTLEGTVPLLSHPRNEGLFQQLGALFTGKALILLAVGLACVFCYRAFCRFLCPLGALYGLFQRFALTGMRTDEHRCTHCGACVRRCPMDVRRVNDRECIACGVCVAHCAQGALSLRCGSVVLKGEDRDRPQSQRKRRTAVRRAAAAFLALLLAGVMVYCAFFAADPYASQAPVGYEAGQRLEDFQCTLLDGTLFRLEDCRGRVVFINQWATYCGPCLQELPLFERLQEEHPEIVVLAFHHWLEAAPGAAGLIAEKGWDQWKLRFALDTPDENILRRIHGDNTMPRTVVLNTRGEVVYNAPRSLDWDMLCQLLEQAQR